MKKIILAVFLCVVSTPSFAERVNGYYRSNGTYVQSYDRAPKNQYRYDNYRSRTNGGYQRDEYSNPPAYNKSYQQRNTNKQKYGF